MVTNLYQGLSDHLTEINRAVFKMLADLADFKFW